MFGEVKLSLNHPNDLIFDNTRYQICYSSCWKQNTKCQYNILITLNKKNILKCLRNWCCLLNWARETFHFQSLSGGSWQRRVGGDTAGFSRADSALTHLSVVGKPPCVALTCWIQPDIPDRRQHNHNLTSVNWYFNWREKQASDCQSADIFNSSCPNWAEALL